MRETLEQNRISACWLLAAVGLFLAVSALAAVLGEKIVCYEVVRLQVRLRENLSVTQDSSKCPTHQVVEPELTLCG